MAISISVWDFSFWPYELWAVPTLANVRPDYDPCGGPQKVIMQSKKKKANVLVY
jgi:hypothetical protein